MRVRRQLPEGWDGSLRSRHPVSGCRGLVVSQRRVCEKRNRWADVGVHGSGTVAGRVIPQLHNGESHRGEVLMVTGSLVLLGCMPTRAAKRPERPLSVCGIRQLSMHENGQTLA